MRLDNRQGYAWMGLTDVRLQIIKKEGGDCRADADYDLAAKRGGSTSELPHQVIEPLDVLARSIEQKAAFLCRLSPAPSAVDQRKSDFLFQQLYLPRQRRLGNADRA